MKKKTSSSRETRIGGADDSDNLYISMSDVTNKRKTLLSSIKDSLILQEETEQIKEIRLRKSEITKNIKLEMNALNSDYQELRKLLPNVKNVISFTEKELTDLEGQITQLKKDIKSDEGRIKVEETLKESIKKGEEINPKTSTKSVVVSKKKTVPKAKPIPKRTLTKMERIKNNLKVIESKLDNL